MTVADEDFRLLGDNIPTLAWMANADGYIFWYNRRWHEYCGTTPAEMEGWGWQSVGHAPGRGVGAPSRVGLERGGVAAAAKLSRSAG